MDLNALLVHINNTIGLPLIIFVVCAAIVTTIALRFVQMRYFFKGWQLLIGPSETHDTGSADMNPFQAFLNALSSSVGNGSIAGMATAIFSGGPGAGVWVFIIGLLGMALRYCEVYLSTIFGVRRLVTGTVGGPMMYLAQLPGGSFIPYIYAFLCFMLGVTSGNAMQANSIRIGLVRLFNVHPIFIATPLLLFMMYVMLGGANRIIKVSDKIVPIKVGAFFISAIIVLLYHWQSIIPTIQLMIDYAFNPKAIVGGAMGYSVQAAMRFGIVRSMNASEVGLGTAAVLFGGSSSVKPAEDGFMGMLSSFISTNLVGFLMCLMLVASGVWHNGQTSIDLVISAYETVFGWLGGWIVSFISISFGLGVLVAYAYIARVCWLFLTNGRFSLFFSVFFSVVTFTGALADVDLVWNSIDLVVAGLLIANITGILWLLPTLMKGLRTYERSK